MDELILEGSNIELVSDSDALMQQATIIKKQDYPKTLDGWKAPFSKLKKNIKRLPSYGRKQDARGFFTARGGIIKKQ